MEFGQRGLHPRAEYEGRLAAAEALVREGQKIVAKGICERTCVIEERKTWAVRQIQEGHMTRGEVAEHCGVTRQAVSLWMQWASRQGVS